MRLSVFKLIRLSFVVGGLLFGCSQNDSGESAESRTSKLERLQALAADTTYPDTLSKSRGPIAADFEIPRTEGGTLRLSDYKGSVILLDFWATWCVPCRRTIPHLKALYEEYRDQDFVVIGVSLDAGGRPVVEKFVDKMEITYPTAIGNEEVVQKYGNFRGIPVSFIIDRDGVIVERHTGFRPRRFYVPTIEALLAKGPSTS